MTEEFKLSLDKFAFCIVITSIIAFSLSLIFAFNKIMILGLQEQGFILIDIILFIIIINLSLISSIWLIYRNNSTEVEE